MKKIAYLSIVALMGVATLSGCSDFLDAENKGAGSDADTYFATEEGVTAAKATAYYQLYDLAVNYALFCAGTDLYVPVRNSTAYDEFERYTITEEDGTVSSFYSNCYNLEQYANFYIETAGEGTQGEAEGIFLRAYAYYLLTQQFGSVPYLGRYVSDASREYPKASLDSLYTLMEEQLTSVYNSGLLPDTDHEGNVSEQAVACLLAKFYLAHAWDVDTNLSNATQGTYSVTSTTNFSNAASWAVKAINGTSLSQSFEDKWAPDNEGNEEHIWSIQYERTGYPGDVSEGGHGMQNMFASYYGDIVTTGNKKGGSNGCQSEKSMYLWDEGDERYEGTFMLVFYNWDGDEDNWPNTGYYAYYAVDDKDDLHRNFRFFPWWFSEEEAEAELDADAELYVSEGYQNTATAWILTSPATKYSFSTDGTRTKTSNVSFTQLCSETGGGTTVKKFDDPDTQLLNSDDIDYRDIVVFDLSDMYLTAAEAYLLAGNTSSALSYVNQVRTRSNATTLSSLDASAYEPNYDYSINLNSLDIILDERARELYGQQLRWVDLRRTKQLVRYNIAFNDKITSASDMTGSDGEIKWLRPIPSDAISGNNAVSTADQNPGY